MTETAILAGQAVKIVAGLAQMGFGIWLGSRTARSAASVAFAIAFAANGVAYSLFNLALPGQRTAGSVVLEGWGIGNWIATAGMLIFAALLVRAADSSLAALHGLIVAGAVLAADLFASPHLSLWALGGVAIYPATALVLGILPVLFIKRLSPDGAATWLGAALAINSVDHLGAEIIAPSPTPRPAVVLQLAAMALVLLLWITAAFLQRRRNLRSVLLVVACMVLPFLMGALVREAAGSYAGMQRTGVVGIGRLLATGLLTHAMLRKRLFCTAVDQSPGQIPAKASA
jgi:hypothetical protein